MRLTMICLAALLAVASCTKPGDFCEVVTGPLDFAPETAAQVLRTDRPTAERIAVINSYGDAACGW